MEESSEVESVIGVIRDGSENNKLLFLLFALVVCCSRGRGAKAKVTDRLEAATKNGIGVVS